MNESVMVLTKFSPHNLLTRQNRRQHLALGQGLLVVFLLLFGFGQARNVGAATALPQDFQLTLHQHQLSNGLRVVVWENHRIPVVNSLLLYHVGGMDDPAGKSGLAHVLEHMMFKGTKKWPAGSFSQQVAALGGEENAFTSQDATGYYQTFAAEHLPTILAMEADRMRNLDFAGASFRNEFATEVKVVIEERNQRTENNPAAILAEQMDAGFFLNHPYRKPIIGWPGELEGLTIDNLQEFYNLYYRPDNAILVIVGDVKADAVFALAEKTFGAYKRGPERHFPTYGDAPLVAYNLYQYQSKLVKLPQLMMRIAVPTLGSATNQAELNQLLALNLGLEALAGDDASPLYRALVIDQKLAISVSAYQDMLSRGPGALELQAMPSPHVSVDDLRDGLTKQLSHLISQGVSENDLSRAKQRMLDSQLLARDSLSYNARMIGLMLNIGLPLDEVANWPAMLIKSDVAAVNQALRDHLPWGENQPKIWQEGRLLPSGADLP